MLLDDIFGTKDIPESLRAKLKNNDQQLDELRFLNSPCTKDCSGHQAGYRWYKKNGRSPNSASPSFNKGAALARSGK